MNRQLTRLISFERNHRFLPRLDRGELLLPDRPRRRFTAFSLRLAACLVRFARSFASFAGSFFRFAAFLLGSGHICRFSISSIDTDLVTQVIPMNWLTAPV